MTSKILLSALFQNQTKFCSSEKLNNKKILVKKNKDV